MTVTLSWPDPEDAEEFFRLLGEYSRQGWLPDPSVDALLELARTAEVMLADCYAGVDAPGACPSCGRLAEVCVKRPCTARRAAAEGGA